MEATSGFSGPQYAAVATICLEGVKEPGLLEGSTLAPLAEQVRVNGPAFETNVEHILAPGLRRGDNVRLDNLAPHKHAVVHQLIERRGARVEFLPPYSTDLNPIEQCWSKVKTVLRTAKAPSFDALVDAVADALRSVTAADIAAWLAHCGYGVHP